VLLPSLPVSVRPRASAGDSKQLDVHLPGLVVLDREGGAVVRGDGEVITRSAGPGVGGGTVGAPVDPGGSPASRRPTLRMEPSLPESRRSTPLPSVSRMMSLPSP